MAARTSGDQLLGRPEHLKARLVGADHVEVMRRDIGHRSRRAQLAVQRERALDVSRMGGIQDDPGTAGDRVDGWRSMSTGSEWADPPPTAAPPASAGHHQTPPTSAPPVTPADAAHPVRRAGCGRPAAWDIENERYRY